MRRIEETRKVQMTGGSTYIFSLPKKWAVQNQLKKGTSLLVQEEDDGSLSIMPSGMEKHAKMDEALIKFSQNENPAAVTRKVVAAYLVGYNLLRVRAQAQQELSSKLRNHLKSFARQFLVGTEIVTDTPVELSLQVLLDYQELSVESALRRMAIIASSMHRDALTAFVKKDRQLAEAIVETDSEVDRFNLYIIRQLKLAIANPKLIKSVGLNSARDCLGYRLITKSVERAADHAVKIAESSLMLKHKVESKHLRGIEEMSNLSVSMFEQSIDSLFRNDFDLAENVIEKTERIVDLENEVILSLQKTGLEEATAVRLLLESVRRTAEYASDIAEIVLNLNVESVLG
jgi:phosphate uptake regulator